jgi:uncharacterized surface protein with fasciclin (FAS1) repeats
MAYESTELTSGMVLETLLPGATLTVETEDDEVFIVTSGGIRARVVQADITADNGVVSIFSSFVFDLHNVCKV